MCNQKKEIFFTPIGTVEPYCFIAKPDYRHGSFASDRGMYKIYLTMDSAAAQQHIDCIVKIHEADYAKRMSEHKKNPPQVPRGKKPLAPYQGNLPFFENEDGTVTFKFMAYDRCEKYGEVIMLPLKVVDAKGKRIEKVPSILPGSEGKVRFSIAPYGWSQVAGASVLLILEGFMLTKLVEFADGQDDWSGQEEDGFVAITESNDAHPKQAR